MIEMAPADKLRILCAMGVCCGLALNSRLHKHAKPKFHPEGDPLMSDKVIPIGSKEMFLSRKMSKTEPPPPDTSKEDMLESLAFMRQKIEAGEVKCLAILWDDSKDQTIRATMIGERMSTFVTMFELAKSQVIEQLRIEF